MKIAHICLACFYYEGLGYQENLLPKFHAKMYKTYMLAPFYKSDFIDQYIKDGNKKYVNADGVEVRIIERAPRKRGYLSRLSDYEGITENLNDINPDIIFVHGGQSIALIDVLNYCKKHTQTKLFIDNHSDYYNTPINSLKLWVVHKILIGHWMRKASHYAECFWGVTPWRCTYLHKVYGIPNRKIALLEMGGDDDKNRIADREQIRHQIRVQLNLNDNDIVIITGGKIDKTKNIHILLRVLNEIQNERLKLILFGKPTEDMEIEIKRLSGCNIRNLGWIESDKVYDYFLASDIAVFPGTHSVLWEQACASGLPCVFKDWPEMHHVDVGGNCVFIKGDDDMEMKSVIEKLVDEGLYLQMQEVALTKATHIFSYSRIARKAINEPC